MRPLIDSWRDFWSRFSRWCVLVAILVIFDIFLHTWTGCFTWASYEKYSSAIGYTSSHVSWRTFVGRGRLGPGYDTRPYPFEETRLLWRRSRHGESSETNKSGDRSNQSQRSTRNEPDKTAKYIDEMNFNGGGVFRLPRNHCASPAQLHITNRYLYTPLVHACILPSRGIPLTPEEQASHEIHQEKNQELRDKAYQDAAIESSLWYLLTPQYLGCTASLSTLVKYLISLASDWLLPLQNSCLLLMSKG